MPDRFVLETLEANDEWVVWGDYTDDLFKRLPDGAYVCGGYGASPTWIRCVHRHGERLHVVDGRGRPFIYRLRPI